MTDDKPKFTPGPWRVEDKYTIRGKDAVKDALMGNDPSICHICTVNGWLVSAEANAALIAAAPEMYALLDRIKGMLEMCRLEQSIDAETEHEIDSLLAKAKGEAESR